MIGFVNVCHPDYVNKAVSDMANKAQSVLKAKAIEIYVIEAPVIDYRSAEEAGKELVHARVDGVIIFLGSWIECSTAMALVREVEHMPMCLWGFGMFMENGTLNSTGSYVSFAMFKGSMDRVGYRYIPVLGFPEDTNVQKELVAFARASSGYQRLKHLRIGLIGYSAMSIYPGTFDHLLMRAKIGPEIEQMDSYTLINRAESISEVECGKAVEHFNQYAKMRSDVENSMLCKTAKIYVALKQLCAEHGWGSVNIKCQYEFSKEYKAVPCVPLSVLADEGIVSSCEGDILNTVSMAILNLLSGETVTYGDAMNHTENIVKFSTCGFAPFSLSREKFPEIRKFMPHPGFTGIQTSFVLKPGRVTVMRLIEDQSDYHIVYMTGEGLDTDLRQEYMPAIDVRLDGDIKTLIKSYSGQHYAICYGDYSDEIEVLAQILDIKTVRV